MTMGILIAFPIVFLIFENYWLVNFPYRIEIGLDIFLVTGTITLVMVLFSVSYHSLRSAYINPVNCIKEE